MSIFTSFSNFLRCLASSIFITFSFAIKLKLMPCLYERNFFLSAIKMVLFRSELNLTFRTCDNHPRAKPGKIFSHMNHTHETSYKSCYLSRKRKSIKDLALYELLRIWNLSKNSIWKPFHNCHQLQVLISLNHGVII